MLIGVPTETKDNEFRVGATPSGVKEFVRGGHAVLVQRSAGAGSGFADQEYERAGATMVDGPAEVYGEAELIVKVKEPEEPEYQLCRDGQLLFTYFHLAPDKPLTDAMIRAGSICIAYETVEKADGHLPLLRPMSEVAGRLSIQEGAKYLERPFGGRGILLGGVPGVPPATVVIVGGGTVGTHAAWMAAGMKADVWIYDKDLDRLNYLSEVMPPNVKTVYSDELSLEHAYEHADLVIGAVLVHGAKSPKLLLRDHLKIMKRGAVVVDVAIDQGGFAETSRPTTHSDPVYVVDGVVHYCVANMPGAVARTSTLALTNATIRYALEIAEKGEQACLENPELTRGLNIYRGKVTYKAIADGFGYEYVPASEVLDSRRLP